ncbi:hypothetical protein EJ05DRAFT_114073 [Pseudovirgaria hyperparasitica]|uniref:DUF3835 domain-containing protein n=1 Tax=Pseudovirgaria hyperparasitica TaxID=470096 RepID=A0A6A6W0T1_9PEZI|nr:uncharacterized protein EJ05DRAFT_114073 [Pseudovirgaria hyperparasitica]KAF2755749.1 hypothetical protein EJ05DRAFT_114073 [Pseudovirgaria hyperparasitica]
MSAQIDPGDDLANLEKLRSRLEDGILKLRTALNHWQAWDFEYEALKEEFQALKNPSQEQILQVFVTFGGDLVDQTEIKELSGVAKGLQRTSSQIADIITRRQDYVRKNVDSVSKQLSASEEKLQSLLGVKQEFQDEHGLPIMDIVEELDDDGNVISGSVAAPSQAASKIVEALDKAGINLGANDAPNTESTNTSSPPPPTSTDTEPEETDPTIADQSGGDPPAPVKKSVSFSEDTKAATIESSKEATSASSNRRLNPDIARGFFMTDPSGPSRIIELDDEDLPIGSMPIQLQADTRDEATIRREMLEYVHEVGSVVAEINLEENGSDYEDEDEDDDESYDESYDDEFEPDTEDEDENEFGMTTQPVITDAYREKMLELERKLNARMIENVGPKQDDEMKELEVDKELNQSAHRLVVRNKENLTSVPSMGETRTDARKKGVRFAQELDISLKTDNTPTPTITSQSPKKHIPATFSEAITERQAPRAVSTVEPPKTKRVSRFKSERGSAKLEPSVPRSDISQDIKVGRSFQASEQIRQRSVPTGPKGQILSAAVIERDAINPSITSPDELDPELIRREAEAEFHKMRNHMIQRQGGFLPADGEEDDLSTLVEEKEDGTLKPVSRFKAARLKAAGNA